MRNLSWMIALWLCGWCASIVASEPSKWLSSTAYVIPKETATEGEGYFAIIEGLNRRLYIGTHANGVNSWLVEFDAAASNTTKYVTMGVCEARDGSVYTLVLHPYSLLQLKPNDLPK